MIKESKFGVGSCAGKGKVTTEEKEKRSHFAPGFEWISIHGTTELPNQGEMD